MHRPALFTIPAGAPFLRTLVDSLLDGHLVAGFSPRQDPLQLATATMFLPTRRAIRAIRQEFLEALGGDVALLPRLVALGDIDEEEAAFDVQAELLALPDPITSLDRQLGLTKLVLGWARAVRTALVPLPGKSELLLIPASAGDAARLAAELGRFVDGLYNERIPFERLKTLPALAEGRFDRFVDITLRFLSIALEQWPQHLASLNRMDEVERRTLLREAEARRFASQPETGPVIVAGSTGSIPATRDLIAAVARRRNGAIVLPGLDLAMGALAWSRLGDSEADDSVVAHPQAGLKTLLDAIGYPREEIRRLGPSVLDRREAALSRAMLPISLTDAWAEPMEAKEAMIGVTLVNAADESEEGRAIALILREGLEMPGKRMALITPDRLIAERVITELRRFDVMADDSAPSLLLASPPGLFTRLLLDVAISDFAAIPLLAFLKHPLCRLGLPRDALDSFVETLELGVLRDFAPPPGLAGLRQRALARSVQIPLLLDALERVISPLARVMRRRGDQAASLFFAAHATATLEATDPSLLEADEAGKALSVFLADIAGIAPETLAIEGSGYPGLFSVLLGARSVRAGDPAHPRIAVYGLLEARLMRLDRVVLAGLDEGIWPAAVAGDPWLNRSMRAAIGLQPPERRLGLAAHDFVQGFGAAEVFITRAQKRGRSPTVPSRLLQRLAASLGPQTFGEMEARGLPWRQLAQAMDESGAPVPVSAPEPRPSIGLRPAKLSVSEVGTLVRDPYAIYARHVLKLKELEPIAGAVDAALRGTIFHNAIAAFARHCREGVPANAEVLFAAIAGQELSGLDDPSARVFWRPRLLRAGRWLIGWERQRRVGLKAVHVEVEGLIEWTTIANRRFGLRARADRIEIDDDDMATVLDFKTGIAPTAKEVLSGLEPQITLETAMVLEGGFSEIEAIDEAETPRIIALRDRADAKEILVRPPKADDEGLSPSEQAMRAFQHFRMLIDRFESAAYPYRSRIAPRRTGAVGPYDHLARVREWALFEAGEAEDEA